MSQQTLGTVAHVNRSQVVKLVDRLEARSWVVRHRSQRDRRAYALTLTRAGQATVADIRRDLDRGDATLAQRLTDDEVARLKSWLAVLLADDPTIGATSLSGRTGYLIAQAHRQVRELAASRLEPLGLQPRHFGLLASLGEEQPCSQSHLAASVGVSAPGVLPALVELETAGLVSRVRNAADRRVYDLTLTEAGRQRLGRAKDAADSVQHDVRERLGAEGDHDLRRLLTKLVG
jgi:DNA-binding MarR family transcriptional regulator